MSRAILALILISMTAAGQVVVNGGRTFLGPLDATNAIRTQPFRMGSAANRPPDCVQGEVYFQTDAVAGQNLQFCTAPNMWTAMAGGNGSGNMVNSGASMVNALPRFTDTGGMALAPSSVTVDSGGNLAAPGSVTTGGTASGSVALNGSVSGGAKITVAAAAGAPADLVLPIQTGMTGQVLQTNGGSPQQLSWVAQSGEATSVANSGASGAAVLKAGTNVTARKLVAGANVSIVENADDITIGASGGGASLPTQTGNSGKYLKTDGSVASWETPAGGGDVSSTAANSYTAGSKQTFAASATTAGLSVSGSALPSSPATGDLAVDSGDSNKLKYWNGSAWVAAGGAAGTAVAELTADGEGIFFPFGEPQTQVAGGVMVALRTYVKSFVLPVKATIDSIGIRVHTASAVNGSLTMGIYNSSCSTLLTSGNWWDGAGATLSGYKSIGVTEVTLNPGSYYLAWTTTDTTIQLSGAGVGAVSASFGALPATLQYFYGAASTGSTNTLALPASCGTRSAPGSIGVPHFALIP